MTNIKADCIIYIKKYMFLISVLYGAKNNKRETYCVYLFFSFSIFLPASFR